VARILICDDSSFMRLMLRKILTASGHEVVGEAGNGKQAVEMYKKLRPDVTTMDITMPEVDGLSALKLIRAENSQAKVVMVSAIGQKEIMTEAIRSGASDFLVKPFEEEQVVMVVKKILRL
jgi:two-component system, chemotaxis family, chemotaxis protein CheY